MDELRDLLRWKRLVIWPTPVQVELPGLDDGHSRDLQSAVDRYTAACGCQEGMAGTVLAGVLFTVYLWLTPANIHMSAWSEIALGIGTVFFGALIGKAFGLTRARVLLRRSVRRFSAVTLEQ